MPRRTKDEAIKTRNTILDAAEKIFYRRGVTRTSLEEIAAAAHVTRGAIYWHFKDKYALCEAMSNRVMLPYEDMLQTLVASASDSPVEDLQRACVRTLKNIAKDKRARNVMAILLFRCEYIEEMRGLKKRLDECHDRLLQLSEKIFTRAQELHGLSPPWTPRSAAMAMRALVSGLILNGLEQQKSFNFAPTAVNCVEAFFTSLSASS